VHGVERHLLYMSLAPRMDHPRRVEPPPQNVQQCYAHVVVEKGDGAPSAGTDTGSRKTEKHLVALEYSKKRPGSSETTGMLENPTSKRRRMIQASRMMMKKKTQLPICSSLVKGRA
jgi:hypothetical protein